MAKVRRKKTSVLKKSKRNQIKKGFLSRFKLTESYTSLILGAIVVLIVGILFVSFARGNRNSQTSSINDNQKAELQKSQNTSSTYTIKPGDDLWSISEDVYKDGYRWVEIAKINKIEDPGVIHVGNKLTIPTVVPSVTSSPTPSIIKEQVTAIKIEPILTTQNTISQNISITGSTYKIKEGDNLWDISVRAYGDGYRWVEIARVNNLANPDLIFVDNVLKIPRP